MNKYNFSDLVKNKYLSVMMKNTRYPNIGRNISNKLMSEEPLDSTFYDKNIYIEVDEFLYY